MAPEDATKNQVGIADKETAKNWLISNGVQFSNPGASAIYLPSSSRLIVRNTQDQLDLIDTIIESNQTSVAPQIEVEAKFVEISQTNLKELSFDWTLGQAHVPQQRKCILRRRNKYCSEFVVPVHGWQRGIL